MEINIDANLSELADKLGIATSELISLYAPRAYAEIFDPILISIFIALCIFIQFKIEVISDKLEDLVVPARFVSGVFIVFSFMVLLIETSQALSAVMSPEGWAIEKIINLIT